MRIVTKNNFHNVLIEGSILYILTPYSAELYFVVKILKDENKMILKEKMHPNWHQETVYDFNIDDNNTIYKFI